MIEITTLQLGLICFFLGGAAGFMGCILLIIIDY